MKLFLCSHFSSVGSLIKEEIENKKVAFIPTLLAAMLREPHYIDLVQGQLTAEQFVLPQQKELFEAMLRCRQEGIEISLTTLRAFVSEEALNELSHLAAQYSDVNCTPDDIRLYLDRIARGMPHAQHLCHQFRVEEQRQFIVAVIG